MAKSNASGLVFAAERLRAVALSYPEVVEEFPWGESAFKVKKKVFLFMRGDTTTLGLSTKLPHSADIALNLTFASPTGYGLGKSGWVSAKFDAGDDVPIELLREWIDESYRAVAPKKLLSAVSTGPQAFAPSASSPRKHGAPAKTSGARRHAAKKKAAKKTSAKK